MSRADLQLCDGLGMRACATCARNVDNNEGIVPDRTIRPAANPPRCMDWCAMPIVPAPPAEDRL